MQNFIISMPDIGGGPFPYIITISVIMYIILVYGIIKDDE
jgi:hypothetical protein